ncbi:PAS domain S-box protein [Desulfobotulus sp. H1]|uniref:histidine kinase n=1 Tax=Desulfobotulus pelophilus TaxID=2823377 RepID=A0ABT3N8J2_9BACT|nr:PAS domain S-box protein [Desulfobotulus pelophilus]MCW7753776.1 PAS domain S-box protein [Desulfobotulus pelophilus]
MTMHPSENTAGFYAGRILHQPCSRELRDRLNALLDTTSMMVSLALPVLHYVAAWKDSKTDIWYEFADPRFCHLLKTDPHNLAGVFRRSVLEQKVYPLEDKHDPEHVHMMEAPALNLERQLLRNRSTADGTSEAIYKIRLPDTSSIWLKDQARLEIFHQDSITLSIGVLTPVSREMTAEEALRKAEKALSQSEKQFRDLFDQSNDAILLLHANGRIIKANHRAEELTGLSQDTLTGKRACDLFSSGQQAEILSIREHMDAGKNIRVETFLKKQDQTLNVDINARPVFSTGLPMIQAVVRDISVQKQLEAERSKSEKFDMIKTLAGGLVHDVNNMLSVITGNLSLAGFEQELPPGIATILNRIETATAHLKNITRKMLILADADTGLRVSGQVRSCLDQAWEMLKPIPPGIRVDMNVPVILPALPMDKKGLSEAFASIMENSLDAMPKEGRLFIEVICFRVDANNPAPQGVLGTGDYLSIIFRDTGTGIQESHLHRIFDPYFSTKTRDSRKGTGLGLSLAYAVIKQHGGHIVARPQKEGAKGAQIMVYLPLP